MELTDFHFLHVLQSVKILSSKKEFRGTNILPKIYVNLKVLKIDPLTLKGP